MVTSKIEAAVRWFSPFPGRTLPPLKGGDSISMLSMAEEEAENSPERLCYRLRAKGWFEAAAYFEDEGLAKACKAAIRKRHSKGWRPLVLGCNEYPPLLKERLGRKAPPLLWAKGPVMNRNFVGVVGSRNLSDEETEFAREIGMHVGNLGLSLVSGFARGADRIAGCACDHSVHFLPGGAPAQLPSKHTFLSTFPEAPEFDRISALSRNKLIYASSEFAIVVSSRFGEGGAWAGAIEAKRNRLCPLAVFAGVNPSQGNLALKQLGVDTISICNEIPTLVERFSQMKNRKLAV